jgi:hypothetical protein
VETVDMVAEMKEENLGVLVLEKEEDMALLWK